MSIYAVDVSRRELIVVWPDAIGQSAHLVAPLSDSTVAAAARLSHDLSRLSSALWDAYVGPASAATDEQELSRRQDERDLVDTVVDAVENPPMPDESGMMIVSYSPIEFAAHRVGRELHRLGDAEFSRLISVDMEAEADSVRRAELGDLSGRAVQAVALDRVDASPVQVAAADTYLADHLLDGALVTAAFDPAAASVAAAHWLAAAAVTAADIAGGPPHDVFVRADDIHACSIAVPTDVVAQICDAQQTALEAVVSMLRVAVAAGEGEIIDLEGIVGRRAALRQMLTRYNPDAVEASLAAGGTGSCHTNSHSQPRGYLARGRSTVDRRQDRIGFQDLRFWVRPPFVCSCDRSWVPNGCGKGARVQSQGRTEGLGISWSTAANVGAQAVVRARAGLSTLRLLR